MLDKKLFWNYFLAMTELTGKKPSKALAKIYYETVKNLTNEEFERAAKVLLSTYRYAKIPSPAEILEIVHGDPDDRAQLAAELVLKAIETYGQYESVNFEDPIINCIIANQQGGWPAFCQVTYEEWKFKRQEFIKLYKSYLRKPELIKPIKYLPGEIEMDNFRRGLTGTNNRIHRIAAPYISDSEKRIDRSKGILDSKNLQEIADG